jgi:cytochrome c peroxidase
LVGLWAETASGQLPPPPDLPDNPVTAQKVLLGQILFWDEQLSSDHTVSCGTCHQPRFGGGANGFVQVSGPDGQMGTADDIFGTRSLIRSDFQNRYQPDPETGLHPQVNKRTTSTVIGAAYFDDLFWDGRAGDTFRDLLFGKVIIPSGAALENQALFPPILTDEMAKDDRQWYEIEDKIAVVYPLHLARSIPTEIQNHIAAYPEYPDLFQAAFGDPEITSERMAMAMAVYQRTLVPDQTPYDEYMRGDPNALTASQIAGLQLFEGKAKCANCHPAPLFSDGAFHNVGLRPPDEDLGRFHVTRDPADRGRFRTPTLRNVGLRVRLMHNGAFADLDTAMDFFDRGGDFADNLDPKMTPLGLTATEKAQIVDFLRNGLTDPRVAAETAPFHRPDMHTEWREEDSWLYGTGTTGSGGYMPEQIALTPPSIANYDFKLGVRNALGGAFAILAIGADKQEPPLWMGSVPLHISLTPMPVLKSYILGGSGPGRGYATFQAFIPKDAFFQGTPYTTQWFIRDPQAAGGFATTQGAFLHVF